MRLNSHICINLHPPSPICGGGGGGGGGANAPGQRKTSSKRLKCFRCDI
jgi:hypothetical protein